MFQVKPPQSLRLTDWSFRTKIIHLPPLSPNLHLQVKDVEHLQDKPHSHPSLPPCLVSYNNKQPPIFVVQVKDVEHLEDKPRRRGRRLTSPERWELSQLIKSGVLDVSEYPEFNEEEGGLVQEEEEVRCLKFGRF